MYIACGTLGFFFMTKCTGFCINLKINLYLIIVRPFPETKNFMAGWQVNKKTYEMNMK